MPYQYQYVHFQTALHLAIARLPSSLAVVRLLLSRGADWSIGSDDEEDGTARDQIKGIIGCIRAGTLLVYFTYTALGAVQSQESLGPRCNNISRIHPRMELSYLCEGQGGEEGVPEPAEPRRLSPSEPALPQLGHQGRNTVTSWLSLIDRIRALPG